MNGWRVSNGMEWTMLSGKLKAFRDVDVREDQEYYQRKRWLAVTQPVALSGHTQV